MTGPDTNRTSGPVVTIQGVLSAGAPTRAADPEPAEPWGAFAAGLVLMFGAFVGGVCWLVLLSGPRGEAWPWWWLVATACTAAVGIAVFWLLIRGAILSALAEDRRRRETNAPGR